MNFMKNKIKCLIFIIATFILGFILKVNLAETVNKNDFEMTILSEKHDLTDHEVIFQIKNLQDLNRDFDLEFYLKSMNFDKNLVKDVYIYEYKPILTQIPTYDTREVCYEVMDNITMKINKTCYNETYQNGTVSKYILDWKPTKMALIEQTDKMSTDYGTITIPKTSSKCKTDDLGNSYDCGGTKLFRVEWKTPIIRTNNGWGSSGYYAIKDALSGVDYDPWWNSSWLYRRSITITNNNSVLTDYQVVINLTYDSDMQSDFDDLRFTDTSDNLLNYWIEEKSDGNWAYAWVKVPNIPNGNSTIYMYYGNPSATNLSNISSTFIFGDDFEDGTISGWNCYGTGSNWVEQNGWLNQTGSNSADAVCSRNDIVDVSTSEGFEVRTRVQQRVSNLDATFLDTNRSQQLIGGWSNTKWAVAGNGSWVQLTQKTNLNPYIMYAQINGSGSSAWVYGYVKNQTNTWYVGSQTTNAGSNTYVDLKVNPTQKYSQWDWIFVRKFKSPEPTYSIGEEENNGNCPLWSNNYSYTPSSYVPSVMYQSKFNITWANSSPLFYISSVNITSNFSGSNQSYPMNLTSGDQYNGTYGYSDVLPAGTFFWYSIAKGSNNQTNTTDTWFFTINKINPTCEITGLVNATFENYTTANCFCYHDPLEQGYTVKLYRNGNDVTATENNTPIMLGAGTHYYICNTTETQNYTSSSISSTLEISQKTPQWSYWINGNPSANNSIVAVGSNVSIAISLPLQNLNPPCDGTKCWNISFYNSTGHDYNSHFSITWVNKTYVTAWSNSLPQDNYTITNIFLGNSNYSATNLTVVFRLSSAFSIPQVLDERTLTPIMFNVTFYNSTSSQITSNNIWSYYGPTPTGNVTVVISSDGYIQRNYYLWNINESSPESLTGYLLKSTDGVWITYWAISTSKPLGEEGSYHRFYRSINNILTNIGESIADFQGKGTVFLDPYAYYSINSTTTDGLSKYISSYNPNPSFILKIQFEETIGGYSPVQWLFSGVSYSLTPQDVYIRSSPTLFNFTISDINNSIEWFSLRLIYNGTVLYSNNLTSSSGGSITYNLDSSGMKGYFVAETSFKKLNYDVFALNRTYIIWESYSAIPEILEQGISLGIPTIVLALVSLFCSFGIAMISNRFIRTGSGIIYLIVLTIFAIFNWFGTYPSNIGFLIGMYLFEIGILLYREVW